MFKWKTLKLKTRACGQKWGNFDAFFYDEGVDCFAWHLFVQDGAWQEVLAHTTVGKISM